MDAALVTDRLMKRPIADGAPEFDRTAAFVVKFKDVQTLGKAIDAH